MRVNDNTFYVATIGGERHVYDTEDESINHLRENSNGVDPESDDVNIAKVSINGDDWQIKEIAWQRIAFELLKREE